MEHYWNLYDYLTPLFVALKIILVERLKGNRVLTFDRSDVYILMFRTGQVSELLNCSKQGVYIVQIYKLCEYLVDCLVY